MLLLYQLTFRYRAASVLLLFLFAKTQQGCLVNRTVFLFRLRVSEFLLLCGSLLFSY